MLTTDPTTVVDILATYTSSGTSGVLIQELTFKKPRAEVTDASSYVYYTVTQGTNPTQVWMDAVDPIVSLAPVWSVIPASTIDSTVNASPGALVLVTASGVTVTLPNPAGIQGQQVAIKSAGAGVQVQSFGSAYIDNSPPPRTIGNLGSLTVVSDGNNWWIV